LKQGKLYLIPTTIGISEKDRLSKNVLNTISRINIFIVENVRNSRRFINSNFKEKKVQDIIFYPFNKNQKIDLQEEFLPHILQGEDIGVMSDVGSPCIADPGSEIVRFAHKFNIKVIPLAGPSSILLALISSGLNGQNFSFLGYLPIEMKLRLVQLKKIERLSISSNQTQIFIETPYRNISLFNSIIKACNKTTLLCIASNISTSSEFIKTKEIIEWKNIIPDIHKKPTIFLLLGRS